MTARRQIREASAPPRASSEATAVDPLIGMTIAGKYTISRLLARGGVGLVYLAKQKLADGEREVVVKVLAPHVLGNQEAKARFEREGQRLGQLDHPNIVTLAECGHDGDLAFIVMEHLVGELLSDYLARKGRLAMEEFVPIAAQVLKGLGYAHSRGLMHRDIKPSNIMLTVRKGRANFVKILDFGMAKLVAGERDVTAEQIVGTATYMAPEQIKGETLDARVDVYAVGVLFYSMLAGRLPFEGTDNATLLYKHVHEPAPSLADLLPAGHDVPDELIEMIHRCLAKQPGERPDDADALVEALIDACPASMFHLPVADGSVGVFMSSPSMTVQPTTAEVSSFDLTRPTQRRARTQGRIQRPRTANTLRPPTMREIPGPTMSSSPSMGSTIIAIDAPRPSRGWGLVAGAAAAVLIGGLVAWSAWGEPAAEATTVASSGVANERRLSALLDQVEAEILAGELDKARKHLDGAAQEIEAHPKLKARSDASRSRIAIAGTLTRAAELEKAGNKAAALSAYRDLLAIEPNHTEARAAVARLTAGTPASSASPAAREQTAAGKSAAGRRAAATGRPARAGEPAPAEPAPAEPAAKVEPQKDPFLSVGKGGGGGIFLPVGGKQ
jgi:serine/threonine protein kinase